ncbi:MAG: sulfatase-like hydrolase/transferase, partial [Proteobacteria bacterium]|nr:sulfatase-like hydrolase/transferase [Pseudomonadota bacterium]
DPVEYESHAPRWQSLSEEEKAINSRMMEIYAAMTTHLDAEVGRLLDKLRDIGALDNTLVMFINDNGAEGGPIFRPPQTDVAASKIDNSLENLGAGNSWAHMGQGWAEAVNAPFRDTKGSVYEGALRVAAFANWAGANRPESINRQYLNNMDLMPTLLELAGMTHPAPRFDDRDVLPTRGKSFAGILRGDNGAVHEPGESIALSTAGRHFMYRGNLKLLKELGSDWELYDLAADPYERHDLAGTRPELLQELLAEFEAQAARSNILDR